MSVRKALARYVVTFAVALVAFVVAKPAFAAAPMCDHRGATMLAPAPQLQQTPTSIDVGMNDEACESDIAFEKIVWPGHAPTWDVTQPDPSMNVGMPIIASATETAILPEIPVDSRAADGVRLSLDRPPRTH